MNMDNAVISCRDLSIGYRSGHHDKVVLAGIEAHFAKGDLAAIAGVNGAGKSTLLKTLSGLLRPIGGKVLLFGKDILSYTPAALSRLVSLVLTDRPDDFYLTVYETVAAGRSPHTGFWGRLMQNDHTIISKSLEFVGVSHLKDRLLNSISDGERQKVMIAKALAQDTPIIILDEPAAFLDFPSKIELMQLLRRLAQEQQKTILFSSHDLDLIIRTVDQVWLIGNNAPIVHGLPEILLKANAFGRSFGNERLNYNPILGHFKVHDKEKGSYFIDEQLEDCHLIASALQRKGYFPAVQPPADVVVTALEGRHMLETIDKKITFENFEQLIYGIQKL